MKIFIDAEIERIKGFACGEIKDYFSFLRYVGARRPPSAAGCVRASRQLTGKSFFLFNFVLGAGGAVVAHAEMPKLAS